MVLYGMPYLKSKLASKQNRTQMRYKQYEMKYIANAIGITIPNDLISKYRTVLGWCAKSVDSLADRLVFREFDNDDFKVNEIFRVNNPDVFFDSAVLSALIASCSFIYISTGSDGEVRLQVIEADNATGIIDPITGLLTEGYAVLDRDDFGVATVEAYFLPRQTIIYRKGNNKGESFYSNVDYPLLVPIIHRPDAKRSFGRSRITRSGMSIQQYAQRVLLHSDVTAEFYSFPQKYIVGLSNDAEPLDSWKATVTSMLQFTKDEEGDSPTIGQFAMPSMSPFIDQLKLAVNLFAGDTDMLADDFGFASDNPSSAESIKSSHERLRLAGRKAQRSFGSGFLNVGFLAACLRDNFPYKRSQFVSTVPEWEPLFEADANTLTLVGDGAIKINQALPGYINAKMIRDLTGLKGGGQ